VTETLTWRARLRFRLQKKIRIDGREHRLQIAEREVAVRGPFRSGVKRSSCMAARIETAEKRGDRAATSWRDPCSPRSTTQGVGGRALSPSARLGLRTRHAPARRGGHCHFGLGTLHRRTEKRDHAQEHLVTARTMYREMGMTYWLEQAEAETELRE
jgi:hypothetical protein